jgi:hypothetical protein
MADLNLVFSRPRYTGGPLNLVFGSTDAPEEPEILPVTAHATIVLGGITVSALARYDNRNPIRVVVSRTQPHQVAAAALAAIDQGLKLPARRLSGHEQPLQQARPAEAANNQPWLSAAHVAGERAQAWQQAAARAAQAAQVHQAALQVRAQAAQVHQVATALQALAAQPHQVARLTHTGGAQAHQVAARLQALAQHLFGIASARGFDFDEPWQTARAIPPGKEVWPPLPTGPGTTPHVPDLHLVFACPAYAGGPVHLVFGRVCGAVGPGGPLAPLYILPARYFMTVHSLTAVRLPDLEPINIQDVTLNADAGSFARSFSATAFPEAFEQLAPSAGLPAQIRITLDGIPFVFVVDSLQHQEAFGERSVRISGRSATALLAGPVARESSRGNTSDRTAQQLALAALEFTGADLDWGITDWLVTAGAWSHVGTPLAAVQTIVEGAGGFLQSHRTLPTLLARHPYPDLTGGLTGGPWNWYASGVVPDVELAPDALMVAGTERADGPDINAVYVSGVSQGYRGLYRRAGTAGDKLAAMITDPLITAPEAVRWRGRSIVGAAGPKHIVTLSLPVLTGASQPGVLDVGQLVQINHSTPWRGRVRSVSVSAKFGEAVRQSVQIERHLETV